MDNFLKKIFEGKSDDIVHLQFQKYSRGEFKDKAVIEARRSGDKFSFGMTPEFSNELVRTMAEKLGDQRVMVSGPIVSTRDLKDEVEFADKKQFMGVKQYMIQKEMSGKEILELLNKLPLSHFGLSFSTKDSELKIKPKAPKSAKPSTKTEERPKADFIRLTTTDKNLAKNLLFDLDLGSFKKAIISHNFLINDLILPQGEKDFAKIREMTKRKGKIIRKLTIDENNLVKEANFEA